MDTVIHKKGGCKTRIIQIRNLSENSNKLWGHSIMEGVAVGVTPIV